MMRMNIGLVRKPANVRVLSATQRIGALAAQTHVSAHKMLRDAQVAASAGRTAAF
jgi:hypothetical protein